MEYERPSGLALTEHHDNFDWIELKARSPSRYIVERAFVQIGSVFADPNMPCLGIVGPLQVTDTRGDTAHRSDAADMMGAESGADARTVSGEG
jgi:hypothetical protein